MKTLPRIRPFTVPLSVAAFGLALLSCAVTGYAADWPRFRGPRGDGISREKLELLPGGPERLWQVKTVGGRGSATVSEGRVYVAGKGEAPLTVCCFDAQTGNQIWMASRTSDGGNNSTPTVADGKVYVLGYKGLLHCFEARTGRFLWAQDARMPGGENAGWGHAGSPLVWQDLVICNVGTGAAMAKDTGKIIWQHVGHSGHATPVLFRLKGRTGVAIFSGTALVARDPRSGEELWSIPWPTDRAVNACDPLFVDDKVFLTTTYGRGGALFDLAGAKPKQLWFKKELGSTYRTGVYWEGCVYGNAKRKRTCFDFTTGRVCWQDRNNEGSFAIVADGKLIYLTNRGRLVIATAEPEPEAIRRPMAQSQLLAREVWGAPALCDGRIYARNESGDLGCWQIARRTRPR